MAFFKKVKQKINEKWYPQSVTVGKPVTTNEVARRIAAESIVSSADTYAVLKSPTSAYASSPRNTPTAATKSHTRTLVSDNIFWEEWAGKASTLGGDEPEAPNPMEAPDASIRIMLARMIFKEAQGLSDAKIFEEGRYSTPDAAKERKYWW